MVPHSTRRKDKLERTVFDASGNTSDFSQSSSLSCPWGKPGKRNPRNPFPFKTHCITFTRMETNARWGTITSYSYTWCEIGISPNMVVLWSYLLFLPPCSVLITMKLQPGASARGFEQATELPFLQGHRMVALCPEDNSKRSQWQIPYAFQWVGYEGRNNTDPWFLISYVSNLHICMAKCQITCNKQT